MEDPTMLPINKRFTAITGSPEAQRCAREKHQRELLEGYRRGEAVGTLLVGADREELHHEWGVDARSPLLLVAEQAGSWACADFDSASSWGQGFVAGFVAQAGRSTLGAAAVFADDSLA
jgi:hypothetical protein